MKLPLHKTKIVCTIGPASRAVATIEAMIKSGMNVARLNFSHGNFDEHSQNIRSVNQAASNLGVPVGIIIDLPGAKMRVGDLGSGGIVLVKGELITLTTKQSLSKGAYIPIEYKELSKSVSSGNIVYLNDGFLQLKVESIKGEDVLCKVIVGGKLLSHKGINLPGVKLFVQPITSTDLKMVEFGLSKGINVFGLSFVENAQDIIKVREFARKKGKSVFLVAKIERRLAIENFDEILKAADGIMIARGDLGVEIPVEEVPSIQKQLIQKANVMGRPVITATQMLESMIHNIRPTRAEVNDVANAILDGTDAVMLSEETAMGQYPVETVATMGRVAAFTETQRDQKGLSNDEPEQIKVLVAAKQTLNITDVISLNAVRAADKLKAKYILTPTSSGGTARRVSRFKPHCWTLAFSTQKETCSFLVLSYGVQPFLISKKSDKQIDPIFKNIRRMGLVKKGDTVILTDRRLSPRSGETDSLGIVTL